jgi:putative transposase
LNILAIKRPIGRAASSRSTPCSSPWRPAAPSSTDYDPVAKWTVGKATRRATAHAASLFLDKVLTEMPFPVQALQVDGGSEFKAALEQACKDKGLALYELPPKRPQLNGAVERCNGAWRYEFYETYDLPTSVEALNPILDSFQHLYKPASQHPSVYVAERRRFS